MGSSYLLLALIWISYYGLHSLFASDSLKKWASDSVILKRFYRLGYTVFSTLGLIIIWRYSELNAGLPLFEIGIRPIWLGLLLISLLFMYFAFKPYSTAEFLGLDTIKNPNLFNQPGQLSTKGLNKWVRHPLYVGSAFAIVAYVFLNAHANRILYCSISLAYLWLGSKLEERKLIRRYGKTYSDYLEKTPF
ncbi:MAG: hypothetical protein L6Q78_02725 [Bacteroidia bacterium]|nr:hypothetical protein [Bacteroidia bacterium]